MKVYVGKGKREREVEVRAGKLVPYIFQCPVHPCPQCGQARQRFWWRYRSQLRRSFEMPPPLGSFSIPAAIPPPGYIEVNNEEILVNPTFDEPIYVPAHPAWLGNYEDSLFLFRHIQEGMKPVFYFVSLYQGTDNKMRFVPRYIETNLRNACSFVLYLEKKGIHSTCPKTDSV